MSEKQIKQNHKVLIIKNLTTNDLCKNTNNVTEKQ